MDTAGQLTIQSALLHLSDVTEMLQTVNQVTAVRVPASVFSNLDAVVAELTLISAGVLRCYRCGRKYRPDERDQLEVTTDPQSFKCSPNGPNYDACMRVFNMP